MCRLLSGKAGEHGCGSRKSQHLSLPSQCVHQHFQLTITFSPRCHIPIFLSTLSLSAGILYTVRETAAHLDIDTASPSEAPSSPEVAARLDSIAVWTIAISLATTLLSMTGMALLDQPKDSEQPMRVNNRYLRLAGRPIYAVIVLCIPISEAAHAETFLEISALLLALLTTWEYIASTEKGNKFIEPRRPVAEGHP